MNIFSKTFPTNAYKQIAISKGYVSLSLSSKITQSVNLLKQIFTWADENLESFDVVIGDYFQKHNLEDIDGLSEKEAIDKALNDGRIISVRVQEVLDELMLSQVKIRMASEYCHRSEFAGNLRNITQLYLDNTSFQDQIKLAAADFIRRFSPSRLQSEKSFQHSRDYQLEEIVVFELLADEGYVVNVYPGAHLPIMKEVITGNLKGLIPKLHNLNLVEIRFRSMQ